jgi:hypothetical protein
MADTTTTFQAALKQYYTKDRIEEILFKDNPLWKLVAKVEDGTGLDYYRVPLLIAPSGAVSSQFNNARLGGTRVASGMQQFQVTRLNNYSINTVDDVVVLASRGSAAAFIEASKVTVDSTLYNLGRDISISMYRDGWGTRGRILAGSSVTGLTLTLSVASDGTNFEVGQGLSVAAAKGNAGKAVGTSGNPLIITGIDAVNGVLTFGFNVNDATNGVPTIAAGDWIYLDGDAQTVQTKLTGLDGWLPTSLASNDSFFGLNRTINAQRLAGTVVDGTSMSVIEALNAGSIQANRFGGKVSHFFMSFSTFQNLVNSLEGKVRIMDHKDGVVGFAAAEVVTSRGVAMVVPDVNCPTNRIYGLQLDTWKVISLGSAIYQIGSSFGDGLTFRALEQSDAWQIRYRFTGALTCNAPGYNCVISI